MKRAFYEFFSIEDAKQKAEYDKMMKLAEEKKREVRRQISKFRRQFKGLLEKNEGLPMNIQLKKEVIAYNTLLLTLVL